MKIMTLFNFALKDFARGSPNRNPDKIIAIPYMKKYIILSYSFKKSIKGKSPCTISNKTMATMNSVFIFMGFTIKLGLPEL